MFDKSMIVPCVDWFRAILLITDIRPFLDELESIDPRFGFEFFVREDRQLLNFAWRYSHVDCPSFKFSFNPIDLEDPHCLVSDPKHNNNHYLFELTGDAIRFIGDDSLRKILALVHRTGAKVTRIDYALDFLDPDNEIVPLMQEGMANFMCPKQGDLCLTGRLKRHPNNFKQYINVYPDGSSSVNYNIGNHGSDHGMFRLYDKKFETLYGRNSRFAAEILQGRDYWFRAELELHNSKDMPWASDSFEYLISSDFNVFAVYGHCIDQFFSFKIRDFDKGSTYTDFDLWEEFLDELEQCIHFVQLVHDNYVHRDIEYMWNQCAQYSSMLSALMDLRKLDRERFDRLMEDARDRRRTIPSLKIRYAAIAEALSLPFLKFRKGGRI